MNNANNKSNIIREDGFIFIPRKTSKGHKEKLPIARLSISTGQLTFNSVATEKAGIKIPMSALIGFDKSRGMLALKPCDAEEYGSVAFRYKSKKDCDSILININFIVEEMGIKESKVFDIEKTETMILLKESKEHKPIYRKVKPK
jgi:hypothetical protein